MGKFATATALATVFLFTSGTAPATLTAETGSAYDHTFEAISGGPLPLDQYRGKVLLIVNTASFCGFTPQYEGLQSLWERYEDKGLVVIGIPSNDFGEQEPKSESEILGFCRGAFGVSFPLTSKTVVKGEDAHPFYQWAGDVLGDAAKPRWNFHKYLVDADGTLVGWFSSAVKPTSPKMIKAIEDALSKTRPTGS